MQDRVTLSPESRPLRIFISYSRRDAADADALADALATRGFEVTIDRRDLEFGEKWQAELAEFIRLADTVVWLVSEASIGSKWVNWELDEVTRRSKRLVPVMIGDTPRESVPRQIGEIHILPAEGLFDLSRHLDVLIRVLHTDRAWLKEASRLADRAHEWLTKGRPNGLLLGNTALKSAERWKDQRPAKAPAPAQEILELLLASRQAATQRQRWWVGGIVVAAAVAVALSLVALTQGIEALRQGEAARKNEDRALKQEKIALTEQDRARRNEEIARRNEAQALQERNAALTKDSLFLAAEAGHRSDDGDFVTGGLLALEALPDKDEGIERPAVAEAEFQLDRMLGAPYVEGATPGGGGSRAVFSVDGTKILALSGRELAAWDAASGIFLSSHKGDGADTGGEFGREVVGFSRQGTRYATAGSDSKSVIVWDAATDTRIAHLGNFSVWDAVFSPDGVRVVTLKEGDPGRLWDPAAKSEIARVPQCREAHFSADGSRVLMVRSDYAVVLSAATGKELARFASPGLPLASGTFSPDWEWIAGPDGQGGIGVWKTRTGEQVYRRPSHTEPITAIAFSTDGRRLVSASKDRTARIWQPGSIEDVVVLQGHEGEVMYPEFNADGTRVLTASSDGTARVWDARTGRQIARFPADPHSKPVFSPDGKRVLVVNAEGLFQVWIESKGKELARLQSLDWVVNDAAFSLNGTQVITAGQVEGLTSKNEIRFRDIRTGKQLSGLPVDEQVVSRSIVSHGGTRVVTASQSHVVSVWDVAAKRRLARLQGHQGTVLDACFSADGATLVTVSRDRTIRTWDVARGQESSRKQVEVAYEAAMNPDCTHMVVAGFPQGARIHDLRTAGITAKIVGQAAPITNLSFSRDGARVVTTSEKPDLTARVWDATTGAEVARMEGHRERVVQAAFSVDGTRLATTSEDGTIRIWNVATGKELARMNSDGNTSVVAFNPDGTRLVTSAEGNSVRIWQAFPSTPALIKAAKLRLRRCLTPEERRRYFRPEAPPLWCVERRLRPYSDDKWQPWLAARKAGREASLPSPNKR